MTSRKNFIESNNQIFSRIRRINNRGINYHIPSEITQLLIDLGNEKHPNKVLDLTYCSNNLLSPFLEDAETIKGVELKDRKSTRLNSSHVAISYAVFCLKTKSPSSTLVLSPGEPMCMRWSNRYSGWVNS